MTNQPGFKMFMDRLKLLLMGEPLDKTHPLQQAGKSAVSNPDLTLEIGNELLITDAIVKAYHGLENVRGRVVIVDQIPTAQGRTVKASAFGIQVTVDVTEAQHMREAYVSRELAEAVV